MTASRRELVLDALGDLLAALAVVQEFKRNAPDDWTPSDLPALHQRDGGDDAVDGASGEDNYVARVAVDIAVGPRPDETPHALLNRLYGLVWRALRANRTLGGLAQDIRLDGLTDPEFLDAEGVGDYLAAFVEITVHFATAEGDPFTAA